MAYDDPAEKLEKAISRLDSAADLSKTDRKEIKECIRRLDSATSTRVSYLRRLRMLAQAGQAGLSGLGVEEMNDRAYALAESREWHDGTLAQAQAALKKFADHRGHDPDAIGITSHSSSSSLDPRTVLTPAEFHELRENARSIRDRCLIDLLGYTGQRVRVIQSLCLEDVDDAEGVYHMPDAEGLKGADAVGTTRPLLGATRSVQEWVGMHPTGKADDYLITPQPGYGRGTPGAQMSQASIRYALRKTAERTSIDKPVNPHAFRHYFVTVCKTQYDMDDGTVKHLIGHAEESNVMETTYRHLSDEDFIEDAETAFGLRDGETEVHAMTPPVCPTCRRPLPPAVEACPTPTCSEVFTPDAAGREVPTPAEMVEAWDWRELEDALLKIREKAERAD